MTENIPQLSGYDEASLDAAFQTLSGEVRVNFKSDYFPMDKMASPEMISAIQGNSKPPAKPISGA